MISFSAYGTPAPKGSMRAFFRPGMKAPVVTHDNARTRPWAAVVTDAAAQACPAVVFGRGQPVRVTCWFALPRPGSEPKRRATAPTRKPDLDKLVRLVLDAGKGIVWHDDAQVVEVIARKAYVVASGGRVGVQVGVEAVSVVEWPWCGCVFGAPGLPDGVRPTCRPLEEIRHA
jgi:crossover junction endodeoxyribonuclease RusA